MKLAILKEGESKKNVGLVTSLLWVTSSFKLPVVRNATTLYYVREHVRALATTVTATLIEQHLKCYPNSREPFFAS